MNAGDLHFFGHEGACRYPGVRGEQSGDEDLFAQMGYLAVFMDQLDTAALNARDFQWDRVGPDVYRPQT